MDGLNEDRIRQRAYEIWQDEGQPEGEELRHWQMAAREVGNAPTETESGIAGASPAFESDSDPLTTGSADRTLHDAGVDVVDGVPPGGAPAKISIGS